LLLSAYFVVSRPAAGVPTEGAFTSLQIKNASVDVELVGQNWQVKWG